MFSSPYFFMYICNSLYIKTLIDETGDFDVPLIPDNLINANTSNLVVIVLFLAFALIVKLLFKGISVFENLNRTLNTMNITISTSQMDSNETLSRIESKLDRNTELIQERRFSIWSFFK